MNGGLISLHFLNKIGNYKFFMKRKRNNLEDDVEALKFEVLSYKLNDIEKEKFYSSNTYEKNLMKHENLNKNLSKKYDEIIKEMISKKINSFL